MEDFFCNIVRKKKARKKRSLAETSSFWRQGQTLKIAFVDEDIDPRLKQAITDCILEWQPYINLRLAFVDYADDAGHIRITTKPLEGMETVVAWSALGIEALEYAPENPTFGITVPLGNEDFAFSVKHEFGHALGLEHEHQHPDADIPWDEEKVYDYYEKQHGLDRDLVYGMLLQKYPRDESWAGNRYDKLSVMHYPISNELTVGDWEVGLNTEISAGDKEMVRLIYPNIYPGLSNH